jgi:hypothetical protein
VLTADPLIGRQVRCFGCGSRFTASADLPEAAIDVVARTPPALGEDQEGAPAPPRYESDEDDEENDPFCPGCGRRVTWDDDTCPHCGEEFEEEDRPPRLVRGVDVALPVRRDGAPHRGRFLFMLGVISCLCGLGAACFGVSAIVGVPLGVCVALMAASDLRQMEDGSVDPRGRQLTRTASSTAMSGILTGVVFAGVYILVWLAR